MDKKAISELLGFVLLVGLSITIAFIVINWAMDYSKEFKPRNQISQDLYCDDVAININKTLATCEIMNTGLLSIDELIVSQGRRRAKIILSSGVMPLEHRSLLPYLTANGFTCDNIDMIPATKIKDGDIVECPQKKISI